MKITLLEYQKLDKEKVNVFLDGKFAFSIGITQLVQLGLHIGMEISPEILQKILDESDYGKLMTAAMRFLAVRKRSESEVKLYLARKLHFLKKDGSVIIPKIVNRLKELKLIDDEDFAKWLVDSRRGFRPKGRGAIQQELLRKGISRDLIVRLLDSPIEEEGSVSELELAKRALIKANKTIKANKPSDSEGKVNKMDVLREKAKLQRYLLSKGFDWDTSRQAVEDIAGLE